MTPAAVVAALLLAFANGANDNAKGVATLIGAGTASARTALWYAAGTTLLGSLAAVLLAGGLLDTFSGKGLVDASLTADPAFLTSVVVSAAVTVLLATRIGMPVSTTHALVGGICGAALSAHALRTADLVSAFVVPLLAAPLAAVALAAASYAAFRAARRRLGVTRETCICVGREYRPVNVTADGAIVARATDLKIAGDSSIAQCHERYTGRIIGLQAQRALDASHFFTAGAVSFARGLNDTPKIAAVMIALGAAGRGVGLSTVGATIAVGGLLAARRVAHTMSHRITGMNDGQAFTANLVTACCVIFASRFGVPVSTTHVSCGSLFGIGLVNRRAHGRMIATIFAAWVTTLPVAGLCAYVLRNLLQ